MSDIMLEAIIRMPYRMAMSDELSRWQYYGRAQQALDERNAFEAAADQATADARELKKALRRAVLALAHASEASSTYRADYQAVSDTLDAMIGRYDRLRTEDQA